MAGLEPAIFCLEGKRLIQLGHTGVKQRLYLTLPYLTLHYITVSLDHHGDTHRSDDTKTAPTQNP